MTTWITILSSVGASTFFCTALMWLCREWLSARLKKSIQHEYDVKLEGYKAGYTRFLTESEIRFSRWHEEKLKAIKEIYSELAMASYNLVFLLSLENDPRWQVDINYKQQMRQVVIRRNATSIESRCKKWLCFRLFIEDEEDKIIGDFLLRSDNLLNLYNDCMTTNDVDMLRKEGPNVVKELNLIMDALRHKFQDALREKTTEQLVSKKQ